MTNFALLLLNFWWNFYQQTKIAFFQGKLAITPYNYNDRTNRVAVSL
jgi:hypothetical protein